MSNIKLILTENKSSPYRKQRVVGRLGDGGLTTIDVELLKSDGKTPYSVFSNHDLIFVGTNAKGEYTDGVPEILDGQKGMIRYTFTKDNFSVLKEFKRAYFQLTDADGNRITFQDFTVDVLNNSDIDQGQVTLYVRLLDQLLSDFEKRFGDQSIDFEERFKVFLQAKESQYQSIYQMYNDLVIKLNNLSKDAKSLQEVQAEILKSIEEHDVFTKQESSANVINQIGGAESAILKKELLIDGTEGIGSRFIKDIPNLALDDPIYAEYGIVPGQPNLLDGTSNEWETITFSGWNAGRMELLIDGTAIKAGDIISYRYEIDATETVATEATSMPLLAYTVVKSDGTTSSSNSGGVPIGTKGVVVGNMAIPEKATSIIFRKAAKNNGTETITVKIRGFKAILGAKTAMDEWTPSQADSGLTPINGGMVPFNEKDYEDLLSDDGIVRAETKIVGRGAEIETPFKIIEVFANRYPDIFGKTTTDAEKITCFKSIQKGVTIKSTLRGSGANASKNGQLYLKYTDGTSEFLVNNQTSEFVEISKTLTATQLDQLSSTGVLTVYATTKRNGTNDAGAISDGVTSALLEVKDLRLIVEIEANGKTIIESIIAANHIENIATEEEAEAGENNEKTMTPLRVFQAIAKWTKDKFVSRTENETVLGVKNFANGLQVGGNNVLTQNGEIRFVTNSTNNSSLESGSIVFKRYGDDVDIYANFQVRASGDLTRDMNIVAESIVDDIFEPGENFSFFVGNETAQAVVKFVGKGIKAHSTLTKGIWYVGTASYKAKNKL